MVSFEACAVETSLLQIKAKTRPSRTQHKVRPSVINEYDSGLVRPRAPALPEGVEIIHLKLNK